MKHDENNPFAPPPAHIYLPTPSTPRSNPMDFLGFTSCRIYLYASSPDASIGFTIMGAPNESGPYMRELGELASQQAVASDTSFVLHYISRYLIIEVARQTGSWTIWAVPMRA